MTFAATIARSEQQRESWKYTSLKRLKDITFVPMTPEDNLMQRYLPTGKEFGQLDNTLIFVNGVCTSASYTPDFAPGILQGTASTGYELLLDDHTCMATTPLEIVYLFIPDCPARAVHTNLQIRLGHNCRLTMIERHLSAVEEGSYALAHTLETNIILAPQAKLTHAKIIQGGAAAAHLATTNVTVGQGAYYDNFALVQSAGLTRNEIQVALQGTMAQCNLSGAMLLRGSAHGDTTTRIIHEQPHGQSREVYKTVLADKAHGVFQGKIIVQPHAQKTDGYQLSRALLLSDQAEMDAKPELEIYADDVKCSHGSTVGDLDAEALFYLQARGIDAATARTMLIGAFINELIDGIQAGVLRELIREEVAGWLEG